MSKFARFKNFLIPAYILLIIFSFFYVKSVLKEGASVIDEKKDREHVEFPKQAKVNLTVQGPGINASYRETMGTNNTVFQMIERVRADNSTFRLEQNAYVDRKEFASINGIEATDSKVWKVYLEDKDITYDIEKEFLVQSGNYYLRYVDVQ